MWVVRNVLAQRSAVCSSTKDFDSREDANAFRKELDFATELYETNLVVSNKGEF